MKCPHCLENFVTNGVATDIQYPKTTRPCADGSWVIIANVCAGCHQSILSLGHRSRGAVNNATRIWPKGAARPISPHVPDAYATNFREACVVLPDSAKASAALSRRCLQSLLHDHFGIREKTLAKEIDILLDKNKLPSHLADTVDGIRNFGNFGAHPIEEAAGTIVEVQPEEAEWCLEILEQLFDFCFDQPAKAKERKNALDKKLAAAKKPPMKQPK